MARRKIVLKMHELCIESQQLTGHEITEHSNNEIWTKCQDWEEGLFQQCGGHLQSDTYKDRVRQKIMQLNRNVNKIKAGIAERDRRRREDDERRRRVAQEEEARRKKLQEQRRKKQIEEEKRRQRQLQMQKQMAQQQAYIQKAHQTIRAKRQEMTSEYLSLLQSMKKALQAKLHDPANKKRLDFFHIAEKMINPNAPLDKDLGKLKKTLDNLKVIETKLKGLKAAATQQARAKREQMARQESLRLQQERLRAEQQRQQQLKQLQLRQQQEKVRQEQLRQKQIQNKMLQQRQLEMQQRKAQAEQSARNQAQNKKRKGGSNAQSKTPETISLVDDEPTPNLVRSNSTGSVRGRGKVKATRGKGKGRGKVSQRGRGRGRGGGKPVQVVNMVDLADDDADSAPGSKKLKAESSVPAQSSAKGGAAAVKSKSKIKNEVPKSTKPALSPITESSLMQSSTPLLDFINNGEISCNGFGIIDPTAKKQGKPKTASVDGKSCSYEVGSALSQQILTEWTTW